jgi:hypothetical protein
MATEKLGSALFWGSLSYAAHCIRVSKFFLGMIFGGAAVLVVLLVIALG